MKKLLHYYIQALLLSSVAIFTTSCRNKISMETTFLNRSLETCNSEPGRANAVFKAHSDSSTFIEEAFPNAKKTPITMNNAVTLNKLGDIYIFQGDIVLDQDQVERLVDSYAPKLRSTCTNSFINYWPNHKVYYTYASGFSGQSAAQAAINEWQNKTGLDFVYGTGSGNYIEIGENYSNGNYSNSLGMKGGKQIISL